MTYEKLIRNTHLEYNDCYVDQVNILQGLKWRITELLIDEVDIGLISVVDDRVVGLNVGALLITVLIDRVCSTPN